MNLSELRALDPNQVPNGTDLIYTMKADGTPAVYTLDELAAHTQSVAFSQWLTDAHHGCRVGARMNALGQDTEGMFSHTLGVLGLNDIAYDTGYYISPGVFEVPLNVTAISVDAMLRATSTNPKIAIIKNGNTSEPIATAVGVNGYANVSTGVVRVNAGDTIQMTATDMSQGYDGEENTFISIRTVEKLV